MLSSKEKRYLKGLANGIDQRYLVGKNDPDAGFFEMIDKALEAKELIKIAALTNSIVDLDALAEELADRLGCELVQKVGHVIVIYRRSDKCPKIEFPR